MRLSPSRTPPAKWSVQGVRLASSSRREFVDLCTPLALAALSKGSRPNLRIA